MPWNDEIFRDAIDRAARAQGKTVTAALKEAGLSHATITHPPENGRRVDVFERLMPVMRWTPHDVLDLIARCFGWPLADRLRSDHPSGQVHVILRNVEVRVITADQAAATRSPD